MQYQNLTPNKPPSSVASVRRTGKIYSLRSKPSGSGYGGAARHSRRLLQFGAAEGPPWRCSWPGEDRRVKQNGIGESPEQEIPDAARLQNSPRPAYAEVERPHLEAGVDQHACGNAGNTYDPHICTVIEFLHQFNLYWLRPSCPPG